MYTANVNNFRGIALNLFHFFFSLQHSRSVQEQRDMEAGVYKHEINPRE